MEITLLPELGRLDVIAYLDGGTGSLLLQATIAGALAAGYFLKNQWFVVKSVVGRVFSRQTK